jgi:hypothetical protein
MPIILDLNNDFPDEENYIRFAFDVNREGFFMLDINDPEVVFQRETLLKALSVNEISGIVDKGDVFVKCSLFKNMEQIHTMFALMKKSAAANNPRLYHSFDPTTLDLKFTLRFPSPEIEKQYYRLPEEAARKHGKNYEDRPDFLKKVAALDAMKISSERIIETAIEKANAVSNRRVM